MTKLEIYSNTMTCVLYYNDVIKTVQTFPDWDTLLRVVFKGMPSFVVVAVRA
jgi:hypothetical protein